MIDIISKFSGYVGSKGLSREIENAPELRLVRRYNALSDELGQMKLTTISHTVVDDKGNLKVNRTPGLTALQARISEKEQALEKLVRIASQIGAILEQTGTGSIHELRGQREELTSTIQSGPMRVWEQFRIAHELPITSGGHPDLLPADLANVESYKAFEDAEKAKMDTAKAALEPINAALEKLSRLVAEANGL